MSAPSSRLARALCDLAVLIAPADRAALARGMRAELDHVEADAASGFAAGCLWSALAWQVSSGEGFGRVARLGMAAGASLLAAAIIFIAVTDGRLGPSLIGLFITIGLFYAGAAVTVLRKGLMAAALYAGIGLALNTIGLLLMAVFLDHMAPPFNFLQAMILEQYALLTLMGGAALTAKWLAGRLTRRAA